MDSNDSVKSEILDDPPGGSLISRLSASVSANQSVSSQKTAIKRENVTGSFTKGHSRSKSQTLTSITNPENADEELSKHFTRSLSQNIHAKSKSLPRPMAERNLPASFFSESGINSSSCDSLRTSSDNLKSSKRNRTRNRTASKEKLNKSNSLSRFRTNQSFLNTIHDNKIKTEPVSPGSLKVSSPSSCYSSCSSPQSQPPPTQNPTQPPNTHQPIIGHHRSRSCPVQPMHPKIPQRQKKSPMTHHPSRMKMTSSSPFGGDSNGPHSNGTPVQIELDINRIRLPQNWAIGNQNGSIYFVDHLNKITTYEDPRKAIRDKLINDHVRLSELNDPSHLPEGFERRVKPDTRQIFFINHNSKKTSWIHPKIEMALIPEEELSGNQPFSMTENKMDIENNHQYNQQPEYNQVYNQAVHNPMMNRLMNEFQSNGSQNPSIQHPVSGNQYAPNNNYDPPPPSNNYDQEYQQYVQQTVGWNQARHMHSGSSSSLPTRFNPIARSNRSSPNHYSHTPRPEIGHRRQRSLDQLRIDQLRIIDKNQSMSHEYDSSMDPIPSMAEEDFSQIEVQPLEIPDEIISQLIGPITTGTTGV